VHPFTSGPGIPCGLWLSTPRADHIFHEVDTTPWHRTHIALHELAHILLGHGSPAEGTVTLADASRQEQVPVRSHPRQLPLLPDRPYDAGRGLGVRRVRVRPQPRKAADALLSSVADWNHHGRDLTQDAFGYWPDGAAPEASSTGLVSLLTKRFGVVSIRWPAAQPVAT
jgi:hypothetical protein